MTAIRITKQGINLRISVIPILLFLFATPAPAAENDQDAIDPRAVEIVMKSAKFLASRPAFSLGWFISFDVVDEEREKITYLRSGTTLMARGKGLVMRTERDNTLRDYYWDGSTVSVVSPNENWHATAKYEGSFDSLVESIRAKTGTVLPMWSMLSENLPDNLLDDADSGAYLGTVLVAGREAHHLIFSEKDEDWQIWISTDEQVPVPIMLVGTEKNKTGWPQYRVYMNDWNVEPDTEPAQFSYVPDENSIAITLPLLDEISKRASGN